MQIDLILDWFRLHLEFLWCQDDTGEESGQGASVAVSTTVRWVLSGPVRNLPKERLSSIQFQSTHVLRVDSGSSEDTLYKDFERLWDLDSIGIWEKDTVHEAFKKNASFEDGKYSVYLPWNEHYKLLPDNYENSVARLSSQLERLRRDTEGLRECDSVIPDWLQIDVTERVDTTKCPDIRKVHYLPQHGGVVRRVEVKWSERLYLMRVTRDSNVSYW